MPGFEVGEWLLVGYTVATVVTFVVPDRREIHEVAPAEPVPGLFFG